jgi:glycosyltransferase involved in cell wall biosynthesis
MIDILMATYNGGEYIETQLLSILSQSYKNWRLIIHDDGSIDNTVNIINKYTKIDDRITLISDDITFGSAGKNFQHLFQYATSPYVTFSDQDDIWLEHKLKVMVDEISKYPKDSPQMVFTKGYLFSEKKELLNFEIATLNPKSLKDTLFISGLQGCSMMFNQTAMQLAKKFKGLLPMHDNLLTFICMSMGTIHYVNRYVLLYRQGHEHKVTANITLNRWQKIYNVTLLNKYKVVEDAQLNFLQEFYIEYESLFDEKTKLLFKQFFLFNESKSKIKRLTIIAKNNFTIGNHFWRLIFKTLLRR